MSECSRDMGSSSSSELILSFTVRRQRPVLIRPARPTPREIKPLSDIDDQGGLRIQIPVICFYKRRRGGENDGILEEDPAKVIKVALAETLVFYYPFAGRLRELMGPTGRKLAVDCTGEGVLFIEADADVTLEEFGEELHPPFPCLEELLFNVPASDQILHSPLLLIQQVTRLKCGGFIFALRFNHAITDGYGIAQFGVALGQIARGASAPSVPPVWMRDLLDARDPPTVTRVHYEYGDRTTVTRGGGGGGGGGGTPIGLDDHDQVHKYFCFDLADISALRTSLPPHLRHKCSTFDVLTACVWRCYIAALQPDPDQEVRVACVVNARSKFIDPPLPKGYYGNAIAFPVGFTTAEKLMKNPLGYAAELVMETKSKVTEEYMKSVADLMVLRGRPHHPFLWTYVVSDLTSIGSAAIDFGWGKPAYAGRAVGALKGGWTNFHIPTRNKAGEKKVVVLICLPGSAMERFVEEMEMMKMRMRIKKDVEEMEMMKMRMRIKKEGEEDRQSIVNVRSAL